MLPFNGCLRWKEALIYPVFSCLRTFPVAYIDLALYSAKNFCSLPLMAIYNLNSFFFISYCFVLFFVEEKNKKSRRQKRKASRSPELERILRRAARRSRRSISKERYVETLVVVDKTMLAFYHGQDLKQYVLTVMNMVCLCFIDVFVLKHKLIYENM